jgi:hypothetical protein
MSDKRLRCLVGLLAVTVVLVAVTLAVLLSRSGAPVTSSQRPRRATADATPRNTAPTPSPTRYQPSAGNPALTPNPLVPQPAHPKTPAPLVSKRMRTQPALQHSIIPAPATVQKVTAVMELVSGLTVHASGAAAAYSSGYVCLPGQPRRRSGDSQALWGQYLPYSEVGLKVSRRTVGGRLVITWRSTQGPRMPRTTATVDAATHRILSARVGQQTVSFTYGHADC